MSKKDLLEPRLNLRVAPALDDDGGGIGEGSGEQAVGPAPAEFESAGADPGAARPGGAGVVEGESSAAFLAQQAGAGDGAGEGLLPGADIEAAAARAEDEVALEKISAGLGSDLAVVELDREHCAAGVGFAAEFSVGGRDGAGGLHDGAVLDGEVDGAGGQRAPEGIDAGYVVGAEDEQAGSSAGVDDAQRAGAALERAVPGEHISVRVDDGVAAVGGGIGVDLGAAIDV